MKLDHCGSHFRPSRAFIGVGSNLGDRLMHLQEASRRLTESAGVRSVASAPVYETLPVGPAGPGNFYNTVFVVEVCLSPTQLLLCLQEIETALGRPPATERAATTKRAGARTIDLDLLYYDDLVFQNDDLDVPHPYAHRREFVLRPMCDLDRDFCHPVLGLAMDELLASLPPSNQILGTVAPSVALATA